MRIGLMFSGMVVRSLVAGVAAVMVMCASVRAEEGAGGAASQPHTIKIVLAGDSTMAVGSGWGPGFSKCLKSDVELVNMARGGRSSKSFIAEGLWKKCLALHPDYVLIQFGHNDQPGHGADRETDPQTTYRAFMNQYVDEARAAGIKPVLITSLSRRQWGADGKIHSTLVPNVEVVKEIAEQKHVPLLDLHALSIAYYEKVGKTAMEALSPLKSTDKSIKDPTTAPGTPTAFDGTHLNAKGSDVIGRMVADELKKVVPALAPYIQD